MSKIPNILTVCRIILSLVLLMIKPLSLPFLIIYSLCGISDMVDGLIARKMNWPRSLGTKLDTIADAVFFAAAGGVLLWTLWFPNWLLYSAGIALLIRLVTYSIGFVRYRQWTNFHTKLNKLTGLLLFLVPLLYVISPLSIWGPLIIVIAVLSALEELIILLLSKDLDLNCPSLFSVNRRSINGK
ncbi:CDP-alcohol phosphatidyltransferase family protein [Enterococcus sp. AZ109]|uniref:CDP-alcohol phosphatidyltransferase family protein n=1 Tax=Enterococcus sp. AZ109 TaxID=2774634 RepID=UPI003F269E31